MPVKLSLKLPDAPDALIPRIKQKTRKEKKNAYTTIYARGEQKRKPTFVIIIMEISFISSYPPFPV